MEHLLQENRIRSQGFNYSNTIKTPDGAQSAPVRVNASKKVKP
jgi:hypothetical protein